ncbi:hypothetical protein [Streptomyces sp. NPDC014656]|uniref:hypothetical protein n=1 Tax=Streptomyces sp. NPDC014656 TaxID=3364878 RepID=UPI0036FC4145
MATAEPAGERSDFEGFMAALTGREMVVVAPHGTVNTGVVTGGQQQVLAPSSEGGAAPGPMRQGPVRARYLETVRRRFVPPPGFEDALAVLESGVAVLVGETGTGRETHALNLLAHGRREPVLVQIDGTVNLSRWSPRAQGVDGYLMTEPADPFALREWYLGRLEGLLTEAGARLVIVLAEAPGLVSALEDHLGMPVLRHRPPAPGQVFAAHLADGCPDEATRARWLRNLLPGTLDELLPDGLPPRYAAQAADALCRLGAEGGRAPEELPLRLARTEGAEILARTQNDPALLACLLSLSAYGGLHRTLVTERARQLLRLMGPYGEREPGPNAPHGRAGEGFRQWPSADVLRILGAHRVRHVDSEAIDTMTFFWPAVAGAVWEGLCRDHADLVPVVHTWLADPGHEEEVERAGRAVAAMAEATGGQSLDLLPALASSPSFAAPKMIARCLTTAFRDRRAARKAAELLDLWSVTSQLSQRQAVAYACQEHEGIADGEALRLLERLMATSGDGPDDLSVWRVVATALARRFDAGDHAARAVLLKRMRAWTETDGVPGLTVALVFPLLLRAEFAWWSEWALADPESARTVTHFVGWSLNEAAAFVVMRDTLLAWCAEEAGADGRPQAVPPLLDSLVTAQEPGFLRWLLAVERGPDTMPGKELAARALKTWRDKTPFPKTD